MRQCEKCGQTVQDGAAFCTNCGAVLSGDSGSESVPVSFEPTTQNATTNSEPAASTAPVVESTPMNNIAAGTAPVVAETQSEKKKLDGKMIGIIAGSVICLIVGIVGVVIGLTSGGKKSDDGQVADNSGDSGVVDVVSSGTKVEYAGYEFVIPEGYEYDFSDEYDDGEETLEVSDSDDYVAGISYFKDATYASVESNFDSLSAYMSQEGGATSATNGKTTIDGTDYLYIDAKGIEGYDVVYMFSKADLYSFMTMIITNSGVDGTQYIPNVAKVVGSAQKKVKMNRALGEETGTTTAQSLINSALLKLPTE
ncbi:zinc ribbon domain-containing protein [Candidatus Saccharibacteria bacterium]|nr:zinc ribbon domain-containing protein [Candidatus Saccharibacteria bacterium]